jgi:large subunit ribosomal protein L4
MQLDVVNAQNEKVGSVELDEAVFSEAPRLHLVWESVVRQNATERRGTHATKNRAAVSGSGRKPWRQKGTGRARVGEIRNPLWRKGGTVFGPQPRSYEYSLPRKVERGALVAALAQKARDGEITVVERISADGKTKAFADLIARVGARGAKTLIIDVRPEAAVTRSARNLDGVKLVASNRVTARDVFDTRRVIVTRAAIERLQETLK